MSVINRMLQDLDKRIDREPRQPYSLLRHGLRPVMSATSIASKRRLITIAMWLVAPLAVANYAWIEHSTKIVETQLALPVVIKTNNPEPKITRDSIKVNEDSLQDSLPPYAMQNMDDGTHSIETDIRVASSVQIKDMPIPKNDILKEKENLLVLLEEKHKALPANNADKIAIEREAIVLPTPAIVDAVSIEKNDVRREMPIRIDLPQTQANVIYNEGLNAIKEGQIALAEAKFKMALSRYTQHIPAREALIALLIKDTRWLEAQRLLYEAIALYPNNIIFPQRLARLFVETGDEQAGLNVLEATYQHAKGDPDFLGFLAALYQRNKQWQQAENTYRQALALRPLEEKWWIGLAVVLETLENWVDAREAYQKAYTSPRLDRKLAIFAQERMAVLAQKK